MNRRAFLRGTLGVVAALAWPFKSAAKVVRLSKQTVWRGTEVAVGPVGKGWLCRVASFANPLNWTNGAPEDGDTVIFPANTRFVVGLDMSDINLESIVVHPGAEIGGTESIVKVKQRGQTNANQDHYKHG